MTDVTEEIPNRWHDIDLLLERSSLLSPDFQPNPAIKPFLLKDCHVLVVGAGGLGCELLKDLALSGFSNIEVIDMDTIDLSNLNRQFLFQKKHIGESKAVIAKESALTFNPNVKIVAHCANIKSPTYDVAYFKQFQIVMNALDNLDARRHVNRLCLASGVPLIESGSTGYLGNVTVIKKGESECFECQQKETPKIYPVCTIRTSPTQHIHCVVWAKMIFEKLFGKKDDSNEMSFEDNIQNGEDKNKNNEKQKEKKN